MAEMSGPQVTILASGVALGVYIPALLVERQLKHRGLNTQVVVLENLLLADKKARLRKNKEAFHESFALALAGQKLANDVRPVMDDELVAALLDRWEAGRIRHFIVFSGFWIPVIEEYLERSAGETIHVDLCLMDAAPSASWKLFLERCQHFTDRVLFDGERNRINCTIDFCDSQVMALEERPNRFVIHGGGWGMGTYREKIAELEGNDLALDIVAYTASEAEQQHTKHRYFMTDPAWNPWTQERSGHHSFPPFAQIRHAQKTEYNNRTDWHPFFDLLRQSRAIVSKPGGATLLDSLASATPLVSLEPFGDYEQRNADLWHSLGLGLSLADWRDTGFSQDILAACHRRLVQVKAQTPDFTGLYVRDHFGAVYG